MSKQVLIILHQATSTPGRIGTLLKSRGYNLIIKRPALGDNYLILSRVIMQQP